MFYKRKIRKQIRRQQEQAQYKLEARLESSSQKVIIFPGTREQFEEFIGYKVSVVDLGTPNKGIVYDCEMSNRLGHYPIHIQQEIVDREVVALINANLSSQEGYSFPDVYFYGLPVGKKPRKMSEKQFKKVYAEWKKDTSHLSVDQTNHPAFKKIVNQGKTVLPYIFDELKKGPTHLISALYVITRADPMPREYAGRMDKLREYWLKWGKENKYL